MMGRARTSCKLVNPLQSAASAMNLVRGIQFTTRSAETAIVFLRLSRSGRVHFLHDCPRKQWNHDLVVPRDLVALAAG